MALGMMVDGKWQSSRNQEDKEGRFIRPATTFRESIAADGSTPYAPEKGRYHLYVSYACPWAHRTLIVRQLKGLADHISLSVVDPYMGEDGWHFGGETDSQGPVPNAKFLREVYAAVDPKFTGRVTVPILYDRKTNSIVNNESREIIKMLDQECNSIADRPGVNFYPEDLADKIEEMQDAIYTPINNGVYRAGFASKQRAYEQAVRELFAALDQYEELLGKQRYLCGDRVTLADWCLFTTLFRFDAVYYVHFKCNLKHIMDYPNLWNYVKELYQMPGVAETCHMDHIKTHYYTSHEQINPHGLVPVGPILDFNEAHNRGA